MPDTAPAEVRPNPQLHIKLPFQGRWVRKVFVRGLGIPRRRVYAVLRAIKSSLMPGEVETRNSEAQESVAREPDLEAWRRAGHRALRDEELPSLDPVLKPCREIQARIEQQLAADQHGTDGAQQDKAFLHYIATDQEFLAYPEVVDFALSEPVLGAVSAYLGTVPVLASISLLWSPPDTQGTKPTSSQRFHNDHEDISQIKLFIHINDVGSDHGVFTFHNAEATTRIRKALGTRRGRLGDDEVREIVPDQELIRLVGPAGSAHFVDTSACLHFGSRPSPKGRLLLQMQYLRCNSPTYSNLALALDDEWATRDWTPIQRLALGLRDASQS